MGIAFVIGMTFMISRALAAYTGINTVHIWPFYTLYDHLTSPLLLPVIPALVTVPQGYQVVQNIRSSRTVAVGDRDVVFVDEITSSWLSLDLIAAPISPRLSRQHAHAVQNVAILSFPFYYCFLRYKANHESIHDLPKEHDATQK